VAVQALTWRKRHYPFNAEQTVNILGEIGPLVAMFLVNGVYGIAAGTWALIGCTLLSLVVTLVMLGGWVLYSVYRYARAGEPFRLRSRWMLVFDGVRMGWRHLQARIHGHEHVEPLEMSSYGTRTAFGVGMIHGIGAETGTQVLLIAAVGGAASAGLGVPMLFAFVIGLLLSNFAIVLLSSAGFVASQTRERIYVVTGAVAGIFSLVIGTVFLFGLEGGLPSLESILPF